MKKNEHYTTVINTTKGDGSKWKTFEVREVCTGRLVSRTANMEEVDRPNDRVVSDEFGC